MSHQRLALAIRKAIDQSYSRCIMEPLESRMLRTTMAADLVSVVPTATDDYLTTVTAALSTPTTAGDSQPGAEPQLVVAQQVPGWPSLPPSITDGTRWRTDTSNGGVDRAQTVLVQPDGKFIVIGYSGSTTPEHQFDNINVETTITLVRYNADGSLDVSFGTGGIVHTPIDNGRRASNEKIPASLLDDGRIIVGGAGLHRYNADGSPDLSFGSNGAAAVELNVDALAVMPDGSILIGAADDHVDVLRFSRYDAAGTFLGTVANGTRTAGLFGIAVNHTYLRELIVQPNGHAIGRVTVDYGASNNEDVLVRLNADGTLDTSFGTGGFARLSDVVDGRSLSLAMAVAPDGSLLFSGVDESGPMLVKYTVDGQLDIAFGGGTGVVRNGFGSASEALAVQSDGKIVLAGHESTVYRLNADGTPDMTFGVGGANSGTYASDDYHDTRFSTTRWTSDIAITADGDVIVVGDYRIVSRIDGVMAIDADFLVVRYDIDELEGRASAEPAADPLPEPDEDVSSAPVVPIDGGDVEGDAPDAVEDDEPAPIVIKPQSLPASLFATTGIVNFGGVDHQNVNTLDELFGDDGENDEDDLFSA